MNLLLGVHPSYVSMLYMTNLTDRLYVVHKGVVAMEGQCGPKGFSPAKVEEWLVKYQRETSSNGEI